MCRPTVRAVGGDNPGQQAAEDLVAVDVLRETLGDIKRLRIKLKNIKTQALVARACNQGADLVEYADSRNVDLVVVGRRPMGPNMHKFLTLTCTLCYWKGNVSDHCVHNMHCPVLVVSPDAVKDFEGLQPQQISPGSSLPRSSLSSPGSLRKQRNLCMAVDGSKSSKDMIQWAVEHLIRTTDELHIISVTDLPAADKDVIVDYQTGKRTDDGASSSVGCPPSFPCLPRPPPLPSSQHNRTIRRCSPI